MSAVGKPELPFNGGMKGDRGEFSGREELALLGGKGAEEREFEHEGLGEYFPMRVALLGPDVEPEG